MEEVKRISIPVPPPMLQRLTILSERIGGVSHSAIIRVALAEYLHQQLDVQPEK